MKTPWRAQRGLSLAEVAIALGILAFCAVSVLGLLPNMLNAASASRELNLTSRMYQFVVNDLRDNPMAANSPSRTYSFDYQGIIYQATASPPCPAMLPSGAVNTNLDVVQITIENSLKNSTNLQRSIYLTRQP